ncbi:MAG: hypothetical protein RL748_2790, partial [Pseudomonadota bacterium]
MKKIITSLFLMVMALMALPSQAQDFKELRSKIVAARESLITMATDKAKR